MELSHIICQATFPLKQVNGNFHTESKENLYTYLRCNYGERQWEIGYTGIQNRYVASIGKVMWKDLMGNFLPLLLKSMENHKYSFIPFIIKLLVSDDRDLIEPAKNLLCNVI